MRPKCFGSTRLLTASSLMLGFVFSTGLLCSQTPSQTSTRADTSAGSQQLVTNRLTQLIDDKVVVSLKGTMHPLANANNDRGSADTSMQLERIQVLLSRSTAQEASLKQAIRDMHTPASASYHKWLTPDQFGKLYGPSDADIATLSNWLGAHGFTVTRVNPGKLTLEMTGSVAQFQKTFSTPIHKYQIEGQTRFANAAEPQIPAALAPVFGGFASLNNFPLKSHMQRLGTATFDPATHATKPNWTIGSNSRGYSFPLAPGDFAVQYNLNPLYAAGVKGAGQEIALINEANVDPVLVAQYRTLFGLPASPLNVILDGNDPGIDGMNNPAGPNGASGEAYLDVELAGSVAPEAKIDLVIGADTALSSGLILAAEHAVYGNVAPVLNLSFGGCEASQGTFNATISQLWEQAAAQGQTVTVSTGDSGSADCDNPNTQPFASQGQAVNGLASTPYNVAVGGTDFYYSDYLNPSGDRYASLTAHWGVTPSNATPVTSLMSKVPEQPWNDSQFGLNYSNYYARTGNTATTISGGGGGASNCTTTTTVGTTTTCSGGYAKPAWQSGTGVPADGVRDLPDVSLFASNGVNFTYYPICASDGDCQAPAAGGTVQITGIGGTSASAPAFAGMMALINEKYGRQGQADFVLYKLAAQYPATFNDVTQGTNSMPCKFAAGTADSPDCIAVANPISIVDPATGSTVSEGQIGKGTTPEYNAVAGYNLATGLGTVDANAMVNNWNKVTFAASSVTLAASQTTFPHGTSVAISGAVTPGSATGAVSLETDNTEPLQAAQAYFQLSGGAYSGNLRSLPGGTYNLTAAYGGDGTNGPSSSSPLKLTVTPEASTLLLFPYNSLGGPAAYAAGDTIAYGTQVLLTGQVVGTDYYKSCVAVATPPATCIGITSPTGSVTFTDSGATLSVAKITASGEALYNAPLEVGTHSIGANYAGDLSYNSSTAAVTAVTVVTNTPNIFTSTALGQAGVSALTVNVENSANNKLINQYGGHFITPVAAPTGVVTITGLGSSTLTFPALASSVDPSVSVANGAANLLIPSSVAPGSYTITIHYPGDAHYAASTMTEPLSITAAVGIATTTTATANNASTSPQAEVIVTTTVTGTAAGGTPSGTISFTASGIFLGSVTLPTGSGASVSTTANLNSASLLPGTNVLTFQYSGDTTYAPSVATITIVNGGPTIALSDSAAITITSPSASGVSTIIVTPAGGFTGSVVLSCAVSGTTGTAAPTCSVTSPVNITGTTPGIATLTVNTTPASAALALPKLRLLPIGGGMAMATLLLFAFPAKQRRMRTLLGALVLMVGLGLSAGCGSGSTTTPAPKSPGTTAGAYIVTVSATATGIAKPATVAVAVTLK